VDHNEDNEFEGIGRIIRIIDHHQPSSKREQQQQQQNKVKTKSPLFFLRQAVSMTVTVVV
jgi:inorganic pyrophosphatase/exopolyphosphatase